LHTLLGRLQSLAPVADISALANCIVDRWTVERDQAVPSARGLANRLYVLEDGFAFDFALLAGGKRHIFDFYGPGAICNWTRPEREDTPEHILFKARSEVLVLDRDRVSAVLARDGRLAAALHEHEVRRAMRVSQRVRALISLPARESLRILLLDLDDEFAAAGEEREWLPMPLTQEEIGDLIGSTSVHVSRTIATLEKDREIERRTNSFRINGIEGLRARMSYRRFFDHMPMADLRSAAMG
jgi:CRP-like cAMP-binding protein